ncbi:helix-turn-helix domain-containing protein, partial [Suttonella ornithocola]|uniref:helix-turn-helix domain-containing protein n=1 Tax=Suttonella ornithocola TaxID=279832 RepID=UPI003D15FC1D
YQNKLSISYDLLPPIPTENSNDIANGETWRAVAKRYKISKFTVYSWIKNPHPKGFTERKPSKIDDEC